MIKPQELEAHRTVHLPDSTVVHTTELWAMLEASHVGDINTIRTLIDERPQLAVAQYDYTSPLHLAVREGHLDIAELLVQYGAFEPEYRTHPFLESLIVVVRDRGLREMERLLAECAADNRLLRDKRGTGRIDRAFSRTQEEFQRAVDHGEYDIVESVLEQHPSLATDPDMFWGEGILSMPSKEGDRRMMELLISYGARVPDVTKWCKEYYFKRLDSAEFLLEQGMNPNHMNWREVTLLHDLAFRGDVEKIQLLLEYGVFVDPIDDEYRSTPLGLAARMGHTAVVRLLLDRGANPLASGAPWATPTAWARARGHGGILQLLAEHRAQQ